MDILLIVGIIILVKVGILKPEPDTMDWEEYEEVTHDHPAISHHDYTNLPLIHKWI